MKISYKVRRNISFAILLVGVACVAARIYDVAADPKSGRAWFDLASITFMTYYCLDSFLTYRRKAKDSL